MGCINLYNSASMSSVVTNLNSLTTIGSTVQEIVKCVCRRVRSYRRRDSTFSRVGGVYWA